MSNYKHLNSPMYIRGKYLKSRFTYPIAQVHFLQGPEKYPAAPVVDFYTRIARNGSALIMTQALTNPRQSELFGHDTKHFASYDIENKTCQNYFTHLAHFVHTEGSLIGVDLSNMDMTLNYSVNLPADTPAGPRPFNTEDASEELKELFDAMMSGGPEGISEGVPGSPGNPCPRTVYFTPETMQEYINILAERALLYKSFGYDAILLDMSDEFYCGEFLYAHTNHRDDEFGGSFDNRLKFPVMVVKGLRERLGDDFIIMLNAPGASGGFRGPMRGLTLEESVKFCAAMEPYADILRLRDDEGEPRDFCRSEVVARQMREAGVTIRIAIATPYMDLDKLDSIIAEGTADLISSARMFICNERLGEILKNGNGEDLNPCLDCGVCRGTSATGDWMSHCTINPELGQEYRLEKMVVPVQKKKRIAVIGGGPGGMKVSLYLKERGHEPVIFEKSGELGGIIKTSRYSDLKWRLERYLDSLIGKITRSGIEVRLNTEATPGLIESEGFDAVILAIGGKYVKPNIPGSELVKWDPVNIYGHEKELGHRVVVIGGSSSPAEAAFYLRENGHDVTILSRKSLIAHDLNPIRTRTDYNFLALDMGIKVKRSVVTDRIEEGKVFYQDKYGNEHCIECDDIVLASITKPREEEVLSFYGCAKEMYVIGDCREAGNMRTAIRDAYSVAMKI
ncbi:MAG: FAD-dependent oxidoreductase [Oscillospiraceae bacterium]|jgi:2,4-dienoyl-CoA reductase-like NADH-dependent reductase (Old Yellow Enzyme family)/thioredoxin reductase